MTFDTKSLIVGSILTLGGMLISHLYHKYEKRKTKHEKAIDVAREYEAIMTSGNLRVQDVLYQVLTEIGIIEKLSFLDNDIKYITFDESEAKEKIGNDLIAKYKEFININSTGFIKILSKAYTSQSSNERLWIIIISNFDEELSIGKNLNNIKKILVNSKIYSSSDKEEISDKNIALIKRDLRIFIVFLMNDFIDTRDHVRNKLEWMSMFFVTGVADSDTVYQSLHQGYFSLIKCFYIDISVINDKNVYDRYYVNITALYKIWRIKYNKKASQFAKQKSKSEKLIGIGRQRV